MDRVKKLAPLFKLLGPRWVIFRVLYALQIKLGWFRLVCPAQAWPQVADAWRGNEPPLFTLSPTKYQAWLTEHPEVKQALIKDAEEICAGQSRWYSFTLYDLPSNWHRNPVSGEQCPSDLHWSQLGEFAYGDVKHIWEPARFGWAITLLRAYWLSEDRKYADTFWSHFDNWYKQNPPNQGIHWKCGQETAIRAMVLCFLFNGLKQRAATKDQLDRVRVVLLLSAQRIKANLAYAYSQSNNHGTSEATALYVIGRLFPSLPGAADWARAGKLGLKQQLKQLVYDDGSFSQHSNNYHRVMLQTVNLAVIVARQTKDTHFDSVCEQHARAAHYLAQACDPDTGMLPMNGGNDGAWIFPFSSTDYLDFRPSAAVAVALAEPGAAGKPLPFCGANWQEECLWFGTVIPSLETSPRREGACVRRTTDHALWLQRTLRLSIRATESYLHRPAHADQLHVDLFHNGLPVLVDAGSYSYNDGAWGDWFSGTSAHNTVVVDERDQMPRLSRFLFDHWHGTEQHDVSTRGGTFEFTDYKGVRHSRQIMLQARRVVIVDELSGPFSKAAVCWHVHPSQSCHETEDGVQIGNITMQFSNKTNWSTSWQADYYGSKQERPCIKVAISANQPVTTVILLPDV